MPVYMCRWHSGDISFVSATNQQDAVFKLDQLGNAETCPLFKVPDFMIHLTLNDDGELSLGELPFGDATEECVSELAYPLLNELGLDPSPEKLRRAVARERIRLSPGPTPEPESVADRSVKQLMDAPTVVIERLSRRVQAKKTGPKRRK
jgi:hypothetical protein